MCFRRVKKTAEKVSDEVDKMPSWIEPFITINGHSLSAAQAMTIRVALEDYAASLQVVVNGFVENACGQEMPALYMACINEINSFIWEEET